MSIELYINNQLCDLDDNQPIIFRRTFYKPEELNTKDAQGSYKISIPASPANNRILGYKNVEEVSGKMKIMHKAQVVVNGIKVLDGVFRITEVSRYRYTGNVLVLRTVTTKNIFADATMNQAGVWNMPYPSFVEAVNLYNTQQRPPCFFPYVLYGLMPKVKARGVGGGYTRKDEMDNTVIVDLDDFPPSINCLMAIRQMFAWKGYNIVGSAFADNRLSALYMSYRNASGYEMPWNYRGLVSLDLSARFDALDNNFSINDDAQVVNYNVINNRRLTNIDINDNRGDMYNERNKVITIPVSGIYEVSLDASITLDDGSTWDRLFYRMGKDVYYHSSTDFDSVKDRWGFELKVLRYTDSEFSPYGIASDRKYGRPNVDQDIDDWQYPNQFPKLLPQRGKTMLVDASMNDKFIVGFGCGKSDLPDEAYTYYPESPVAMVPATGWSWNPEYSQTEPAHTASNVEGYLVATLANEGDPVIIEPTSTNERILANFGTPNSAAYTAANSVGGRAKAYVYLTKGEKLALVSSSGIADEGSHPKVIRAHIVDFNIKVRPIAFDKEFADYIDDAGQEYIDANSDMPKDAINLVQFMPATQKIDDWLTNFCNTFNLRLSQSDANTFSLDAKQSHLLGNIRSVIDIDGRANVDVDRTNAELKLPSVYQIGFTIDTSEQGYIETGDTGTVDLTTGNIYGNPITQTSSFSYNWFKDIHYTIDDNDRTLQLPIISGGEPWRRPNSADYAQMMLKTYTDQPQRFWYKGDNFAMQYNGEQLQAALVVGSIPGSIELSYHRSPISILTQFFTVITNNNLDYTIVECVLTPDEYNRLGRSYVRFNGDIYWVATVENYDYMGRTKAKVKMIRRLL